METIFASPDFLPEILNGKYSRWAKRLDADSAQAILLAVGEFGRFYSAMRLPDGTYPVPIFYKSIGAEFRMVAGLEALAKISAKENPRSFILGPWGGFSLSQSRPVFSHEFSDRLSQNPLSAWAHDIDENSFGLILWNIGEYCCRIGRYPPTFDDPQNQTRRMRAALRYLNMIYEKASRT